MHTPITQQDIKRLFAYRSDGVLVRRTTARFNAIAGSVAGCVNGQGYIQTQISRKNYQNHRLVWMYHYGYFPEGELDHINRVRTDNRIENLREVSRSCNMRNRTQQRSSSGIKGITWDTAKKLWVVQIQVANINRYLGAYVDIVEATCHRLAAEQCLDWVGCEITSPAYLFTCKYLQEQNLKNGDYNE